MSPIDQRFVAWFIGNSFGINVYYSQVLFKGDIWHYSTLAWKVVSLDLPDCSRSQLHIFCAWEPCPPPSRSAVPRVLYQLYVSIVTSAQLLSSIKSARFALFGIVDDLLLFGWLILFLGESWARVANQGTSVSPPVKWETKIAWSLPLLGLLKTGFLLYLPLYLQGCA